jgi:hypothetical protein
MMVEQAKLNVRVKTLVEWSGVPIGTQGVIDEDYGTGVTVAWDLPFGIVKPGYRFDIKDPKTWPFNTGICRDGFDKETELQFLEVV